MEFRALRLRLLKTSLFSLLTLLAIVGLAIALFFWRVSQGPISLSFLNARIETAINQQLTDMKVSLGGANLELDRNGNIPRVRFRNLVLRDNSGNILASAPRAGVSLDTASLLSGKIVADTLELIGPKISARRNLDGTLTLGVSGQLSETDEPVTIDENFQEQTNNAPALPAGSANGAKLIALLDSRDSKNSVSALKSIRISQAALNVFDDANGANWFAPSADLTFNKMPYGFLVLAKADVATSSAPWHAELSATYHRDTKSFAVSTTVENLIPANVAEKIFALSQFAKVQTPLSGHIEIELKEDGTVSKANAELTAGAGQLNLPDYLAQPISIDDGNFRVNYEASSGAFDIVDSSLLVGGSRADISGKLSPVRLPDGKLDAFDIALQVQNLSIESKVTDADPVPIDRIEFKGRAAIEQARLDISDLVVMSGNTGVRMRGIITGGDESAGIQMAGRVRDVSAKLLKKLWPPIVAARSRAWVTDNVIEGRITEGTFQINLPANALAKAKRDKVLPKNAINFKFKMEGITSHYFKDLPLVTDVTGEAYQIDNDFDVSFSQGQTKLESGRIVKLENGTFAAHGIMQEEVQGVFGFDLSSPIDAMVELANQPDLNLIKTDLTKVPKLQGAVSVGIALEFPLIKNVPKDRVEFSTKIAIEKAAIAKVLPGIDITHGTLNVDVSKDIITVSGPAKVNGLDAKIIWKKPRAGGAATSQISAILDEETREKLGVKISDYLSGPTPVTAEISTNDKGQTTVTAKADLSKAKMKVQALGWKRPAQDGTSASFVVTTLESGTRQIDDFKLDGPNLHLRGNLEIGAGGTLKSVTMDEIRIDEDNAFAATIVPGEANLALTVSGKNFDARPYIQSLISPVQTEASGSPAPTSSESPNQDFTLKAKFKHVTAFRGEAVDDVVAVIRARGGKIAEANITGTFLSGQPLRIKVTPLPEGRDLKVFTSDGGAAVRASNFYSKIAGGELQFSALIGNEMGSPLRNGQLQIKNFEVRNEAALAELDQRGKPKKSGPRKGGIAFKKLWLPFAIDNKFVRLGDVTLRGADMCATADGVIRKKDGALDVTGSVIPACGLTGAFNNVPLLGDILSGGNKGEGLFGVTYAMGGTLAKPDIKVNPISALAPGIFRRLFDFNKPAGAKKNYDEGSN